MKILVTGGAGYIGSVLIGKLIEKGYDVICLDKLIFGDEGIKSYINMKNFKIIVDDTRTFNPEILSRVDIVVDLAAISQPDPLGLLKKQLFYEMNYKGPLRVASLSKKYNVERYIFASSCSVYGFQEGLISEETQTKPLEEYARTKLMAEKEIKNLSSKDFCVTIIRPATVYGFSKKMRFDLVVNGMVLSLYKTGIIRVMRPGTQIRPVVHLLDLVKAIILIIEANENEVNGEIFNIGSNDQNYQIYELAKLIGDSIGKPYNIEWYGEPDTRSYRVDFTKISKKLKFVTSYTPIEGAREIYKALENGIITETPETNVIRWWTNFQELIKNTRS
ncbi:MAG: NAD(P)-dependent oxidoreductase [Candidatus Methanomethylicaceae archaeon]